MFKSRAFVQQESASSQLPPLNAAFPASFSWRGSVSSSLGSAIPPIFHDSRLKSAQILPLFSSTIPREDSRIIWRRRRAKLEVELAASAEFEGEGFLSLLNSAAAD